jgi:hypothetical protein
MQLDFIELQITQQRFSKGIKNYKCKKTKEKDYRNENRQAEVVENSKRLVKFFDNRDELNKEFNSRMSKCTDRLDPDDEDYSRAYRKCSKTKWAKDFQKKLKLLEEMINHLATKEPILFAKAENSKSIFRQWTKYTKLQKNIKEFAKIDLSTESGKKRFTGLYSGNTTNVYDKLSESINNVCDSDKVPLSKLLLMDNLTRAVKSRYPVYYDIERKCLGKPKPDDLDGTFGAGTLMACLVGSIGPQAIFVGSVCASLFLGDSIAKTVKQNDFLEFVRDAKTTNNLITSADEEIAVRQLESAKLDLALGIALLPLDFAGARAGIKAIKKSMKKIKKPSDQLIAINSFDQELKSLSSENISASAKRKKFKRLLKKYENSGEIVLLNRLKQKYPNVTDSNLEYFVKRYPCLK